MRSKLARNRRAWLGGNGETAPDAYVWLNERRLSQRLPARTSAERALLGHSILRLVLQTADVAIEESVHLRRAQGTQRSMASSSEMRRKPSCATRRQGGMILLTSCVLQLLCTAYAEFVTLPCESQTRPSATRMWHLGHATAREWQSY